MATKNKYYIGLSANFHDPAIALVSNEGEIVFAEATERYLQSKRAMGAAVDNIFYIDEILKEYPVSDYEIAVNWTDYSSFHTFLKSASIIYALKNYPSITKWFGRRMKFNGDKFASSVSFSHSLHFSSLTMAGSSFRRTLNTRFNLPYKALDYFDHHLCHAYHAFYTAPCADALILVLDGAGDEASSFSIYLAAKQSFTKLFRNKSKASLGKFYGILTTLCGFYPAAGEQWKVMGMAPYGKLHKELYIDLNDWMSVSGIELKIKKPRQFLLIREKIKNKSYSGLTRYDIAYTGQLIYEEMVIKLLGAVYNKWPHTNLIITGGCGLNSACNGKIHTDTPYKNVYIPSAPADDGGAVGAALLSFKKHNPLKQIRQHQRNPYLGFDIKEEDILFMANFSGYSNKKMEYADLYSYIAKELQEGKIVGWAQGRAEFGPRALGNRSILANPSLPEMKDKINTRVKFREEFRPFAPAILEECADKYFENYQPTPYMERVLTIKESKRSALSAVNHIDNTGRLQTVTKEDNEHFHNLINEFYRLTNIPVLLNTSFNVMGKPIVNSVKDMAAVFTNSGLDILVINQYVFKK